jgi:hypothetical protein
LDPGFPVSRSRWILGRSDCDTARLSLRGALTRMFDLAIIIESKVEIAVF